MTNKEHLQHLMYHQLDALGGSVVQFLNDHEIDPPGELHLALVASKQLLNAYEKECYEEIVQ